MRHNIQIGTSTYCWKCLFHCLAPQSAYVLCFFLFLIPSLLLFDTIIIISHTYKMVWFKYDYYYCFNIFYSLPNNNDFKVAIDSLIKTQETQKLNSVLLETIPCAHCTQKNIFPVKVKISSRVSIYFFFLLFESFYCCYLSYDICM